jgi:hypothetical protein
MGIRKSRYHFSIIILSLIFSLMGGAGIGLVTFLTLIVQGGMELVFEFWKLDGKGFEDSIKWPVLLIGFLWEVEAVYGCGIG